MPGEGHPRAAERALHELAELELPSPPAGAAAARPDRRQHPNRRVHTRYQITTTADFVDVESGARGSARSSDISLGGCFIDSTSPYATGTRLRLRLSKEGRACETLAEVVCSMPGMGMGMRFIDPAPAALRVVEDWIGELTGVAPFAPAAGHPQPSLSRSVSPESDTRYLLMELVVLLMRKGVLDASEGDHLVRRLS
jgi:hypothetical protein